MSYLAKVGSFNIDTGKTVGQIQSISGLGFQPKVIMFWWSGSTSTEEQIASGTYNLGFGAMINDSQRFCVDTIATDGVADTDVLKSDYNTEVIRTYINTSTIDGIMDYSSMDSDGFSLIVDDQFTQATRISYLALGGTKLTNYYIGTDTSLLATGVKNYTGVGFKPDALIVIDTATNVVNSEGLGLSTSFGWATGSGTGSQGVVGMQGADNQATSNARGYGYNKEITSVPSWSSTTNTYRNTFVSFDTDGFSLNNLEATSAIYLFYIALKGGRYFVGDLTTRTDGNDITETLSFQPTALMFLSANRILSTQDVNTTNINVSIGAATSTSNRAVQAIYNEHNLPATETAHANYDSAVYANVQNDAIVGLMDLKSISPSGFICVMDDADPLSSIWVTYLAMGADPNSDKSAYTSGKSNTLSSKNAYVKGKAYAPPSYITSIRLESDLNEFTSTETDGGNLSWSNDDTAKAVIGSNGAMKCLINDTNIMYGEYKLTSGNISGVAQVRFYFDWNSLTMADNDGFYAFDMFNSSDEVVARLYWTRIGSRYVIHPVMIRDSATEWGATVDLSDAPHCLEVRLRRAVNSTSNNGTMVVWLDDVQVDSMTGDNYDKFYDFRYIRVGVNGADTGTSGSIYFDEIVINDTGLKIGLYPYNQAYLRGQTSANSSIHAFLHGSKNTACMKKFVDGYGGDVQTYKDTYIAAASPTQSYGSNNSIAGSINDNVYGLLTFNLSSIDATFICDSATLYLYVSETKSSNRNLSIHELMPANTDWVEGVSANPATDGQSTWNYKEQFGPSAGTAWAGGAGCDVSGTDYVASTIGTALYIANDPIGTEIISSLAAGDIEDWFGSSYEGYGLILRSANAFPSVYASDFNTTSYRPNLVVVYSTEGAHKSAYLKGQSSTSSSKSAFLHGSINTIGKTTFIDGYGGDVQTYKDTYIVGGSANSYGAAALWYLGANRHMLHQFNLSSIPSTVTCVSATFYIYQGETGFSGTWEYKIYSIASGNANWPEGTKTGGAGGKGDCCWNYKEQTPGEETSWAGSAGLSTAGTDFINTVIGTLSGNKSDAVGTEYSTLLTASVIEDWFGATNTNYGIVSKNSGTGNPTICSSDNATTGYRPKLVVVYSTEGAFKHAYLNGQVYTSDTRHAYLHGQDTASTSKSAFLRGSKNTIGKTTFVDGYGGDVNTNCDTYIDSTNPEEYWSNSTSLSVSSGINRGLIKFTLSSIPDDASITSATLTLKYFYTTDVSGSKTIAVYRQKRAWGEMDSFWTNWNEYDYGNDWATAGGFGADDCEQSDIGSTSIPYDPYGDVSFTLTASKIEEMLDGGSFTNNGFLLKFTDEGSGIRVFHSSDNATGDNRPKLVVVYSTEGAFKHAYLKGQSSTSNTKSAFLRGCDTASTSRSNFYKENFEGVEGALSGDWTTHTNFEAVRRNGSGLGYRTTGGNSVSIYTAGTFGNDQYAQAKVVVVAEEVGFIVRSQGTGSGAGFVYAWFEDNGTTKLSFWNGGWNNIATGNTGDVQQGDTVRFEVVGWTYKIKVNGITKLTWVNEDHDLYTSGKTGVGIFNSVARADDWEGGSLVNLSAYLKGVINTNDSKSAYTNGSSVSTTDSKSAYLKGQTNTISNKSAYLRGAIHTQDIAKIQIGSVYGTDIGTGFSDQNSWTITGIDVPDDATACVLIQLCTWPNTGPGDILDISNFDGDSHDHFTFVSAVSDKYNQYRTASSIYYLLYGQTGFPTRGATNQTLTGSYTITTNYDGRVICFFLSGTSVNPSDFVIGHDEDRSSDAWTSDDLGNVSIDDLGIAVITDWGASVVVDASPSGSGQTDLTTGGINSCKYSVGYEFGEDTLSTSTTGTTYYSSMALAIKSAMNDIKSIYLAGVTSTQNNKLAFLKGKAEVNANHTAYTKGQADAPAKYLIYINNETGDESQWSSKTGTPSISNSAGLAGSTWGISAPFGGAANQAFTKTLSSAVPISIFRERFYVCFDDAVALDNSTGCLSEIHRQVGSKVLSRIYFQYLSGSYRISARTYNDNDTETYTSYYPITSGEHYIEIEVARATTSTSSNGYLKLWIDGTYKETISNVDNYDLLLEIRQADLGAFFQSATSSGAVYADDLVINISGLEIGPYWYQHAFTKGQTSVTTQQAAYAAGSVLTSISTSAYTCGQYSDSTSVPAYLEGVLPPAATSKSAYLKGISSLVSSSKSVYLRGQANAPADGLFRIDHETGDFSQYTSYVGNDGNLSISDDSVAQLLVGSRWALRCNLVNTNAMYGRKIVNTPLVQTRVRFYFDPNGYTCTDGGSLVLFLLSAASYIGYVRVRYYAATGYEISARLFDDAGGGHDTSWYSLTDGIHCIEAHFIRATGVSDNNGNASLYIDDAYQGNVTGVDSYTRWVEPYAFSLGCTIGAPSGCSGVVYLDDFIVNDTGLKIGLYPYKHAYLRGEVTTSNSKSGYLCGKDTSITNKAAYIKGSTQHLSNKAVYLIGQNTSISNKFAYLNGTTGETQESSSIHSFLQSFATIIANKSAYLTGQTLTSTSKFAYTVGTTSTTSNKSAYLSGKTNTLANQTVYIKGSISTTDSQAVFTEGYLSNSSSKVAYTEGTEAYQFEIEWATLAISNFIIYDNQIAFTQGKVLAIDSALAYTSGKETSVTNKSAYTRGSSDSSDNQSAYTRGSTPVVTNQYAYTRGSTSVTNSKTAFIQGKVSVVYNKSAFVKGSTTEVTSKSAYIAGKSTHTSNKSAYTHGSVNTTDQQVAYLHGKVTTSYSITAFVQGKADTLDNQIAYLLGAFGASDNQSAYLNGRAGATASKSAFINGYSSNATSIPAFTRGSSTYSDNQIAFVHGKATSDSTVHSYLRGQADFVGNKSAYLRGQATFTGNKAAYTHGKSDYTASKTSYTRGSSPALDNQIAYIHGKADETASKAAYLKGQSSFVGNKPAYLVGKSTYVANKFAYTHGKADTSDSQFAYTQGSINYTSSKPAYIASRVNTTISKIAFTEGYAPGVSTQKAYIQGLESNAYSHSAFTQGAYGFQIEWALVATPVKKAEEVSSSSHAYLVGKVDVSDSQFAYVHGKSVQVDSKFAYVHGKLDTSDSQYAYVSGKIIVVSSQLVFTKGGIISTDNKQAYVQGATQVTDNKHAYLNGYSANAYSVSAYTKGSSTTTNLSHAYLSGKTFTSDARHAYLHGSINVIDNKSAYIASRVNTTDTRYAFVNGYSANIFVKSAYTSGRSTLVENKSAYTSGILRTSKYTYTSGKVVTINNKSAYTSGEYYTTSQKNAYISGKNIANSQKNAFISGKSTAQTLTNAYLCGKIEIVTNKAAYIRGTSLTTTSKQAFVSGKILTTSNVHAYLNGGVITSSYKPAFIAVQAIVNTYRNAYLAGFLANVTNKQAYTFGVELIRNVRHAFVSGTVPTSIHIIECETVINTKITCEVDINTRIISKTMLNTNLTFGVILGTKKGYKVIINSFINRIVKI